MDFLFDDPWTVQFMESVNERIANNRPLSSNQSRTILNIIHKVKSYVPSYGICTAEELDEILRHPKFKIEIYESSNIPNEVRHIGSNYLAFRFKFDPAIMRDILSLNENYRPYFVREAKVWVVPVVHNNYYTVNHIIKNYKFSMDDACREWMKLAAKSVNQPSALAVNDNLIIANVCDNEPLGLWMQFVADGVPLLTRALP
jgi:hypothetical protein